MKQIDLGDSIVNALWNSTFGAAYNCALDNPHYRGRGQYVMGEPIYFKIISIFHSIRGHLPIT